MRLELDIAGDDWSQDYRKALIAFVERVGVTDANPRTGMAAYVRLAARTDDGQAVIVAMPWHAWRTVTEHIRQTAGPHVEHAPWELEVGHAMARHQERWKLTPDHSDGTLAEDWAEDARDTEAQAMTAALEGELTWAHTVMAAFYAVLATEEPAELRARLAELAGGAARWMTAIDQRDPNAQA